MSLKDVSLLSALAVWLGWLAGDTIYRHFERLSLRPTISRIFVLWESKTRGMFILPPPLVKHKPRTPEMVRLQPGNSSGQEEEEEVFDDVEPYDFDSVKSFTFQRNHVYRCKLVQLLSMKSVTRNLVSRSTKTLQMACLNCTD